MRLGAFDAAGRGLPAAGGAAASGRRSVAGVVETRRRMELTPATIPPRVRRPGWRLSVRMERRRRRTFLRAWIRRGRRGAATARVGGGGDSGVAREREGEEEDVKTLFYRGPRVVQKFIIYCAL